MRLSLIVTTFLVSGLLAACGHDHSHDDVHVPPNYAGMTNPLDGDVAAAEAGRTLYADNCVECHGDNGRGDGVEAAELNPAPADFHDHTLDHADDYLYWRIAEGGNGEPIQSEMPGWKTQLTETQIWQLITHMRGMRQ